MQNNDVERDDEREEDRRAAVEAADDTGMVSQQEQLHVVGDAETGSLADE